jgi:hypothetical protein
LYIQLILCKGISFISFYKIFGQENGSFSPQLSFGIDVVKVHKLCDITKPWLEKVGALCKKKEDVPI